MLPPWPWWLQGSADTVERRRAIVERDWKKDRGDMIIRKEHSSKDENDGDDGTRNGPSRKACRKWVTGEGGR